MQAPASYNLNEVEEQVKLEPLGRATRRSRSGEASVM
jgi:hypothetical protein